MVHFPVGICALLLVLSIFVFRGRAWGLIVEVKRDQESSYSRWYVCLDGFYSLQLIKTLK